MSMYHRLRLAPTRSSNRPSILPDPGRSANQRPPTAVTPTRTAPATSSVIASGPRRTAGWPIMGVGARTARAGAAGWSVPVMGVTPQNYRLGWPAPGRAVADPTLTWPMACADAITLPGVVHSPPPTEDRP
jgi:hypothetical protein